MQKLLSKQNIFKTTKISEKNNLTIEDIEKFYLDFNKNDLKIGLEYERLSLDKKTLKNSDYETVSKIIIDFSKIMKWDLIYDSDIIIGAKDDKNNSISLEPGCQLEISLKPYSDILDINSKLKTIVELLDKIADVYNVSFLGYGTSLVSDTLDITLLQKSRYKIMNNYLPKCLNGELSQKMMRQTAGIQVNIDYFNSADAYNKMYFLNLIMPFVCGLTSNSPVISDKNTQYKSYRNYIWTKTGSDRCNLFYKNIFSGFNKEKNIFKNYIKEIINVPMIFIIRDEKCIEINGKLTFKDFMTNGYGGYFANINDYILHQSLCFPDIRMKKYIEIRNHDSQNPQFALALCAFYKGLMSNNINELIKKFSYLKINDIQSYYEKSAKYGLDFEINKNINAWDIIQQLYNLSLKQLKQSEKIYLEPINNLIKNKITNADILLNFCVNSGKDVFEFYFG